ncbi:polysaccharide lyase family 8 super-sandwich domain-containing protein [Pedobacter borealis]|uniref:polysaccharide lyase family 8 super-sandwich domain-containing protein n=1 Tax=Pedobacter borealis TaxID=475254 RepID=UPI000493261A|nr:polysaccharide lyase family 8 super-sandwich domain-containing protein [Pedobacter borealis]
MKKSFIGLTALLILITVKVFSQNAESGIAFANYHRYYADGQKTKNLVKEKSISDYRQYYSTHGYHVSSLSDEKLTVSECISLLNEEGLFSDLITQEKKIVSENLSRKNDLAIQQTVAGLVYEAYNRIWKIADGYRKGELSEKNALTNKYIKAIVHYGNIEISRSNKVHRFHASCFALPTAAVNIYFAFLKQMNATENGKNTRLNATCDMLKAVALQAWTQPFRNDETDKNVVQIDRFRKHVWWVGGNALAYRPLLLVAYMYKSIPMVDLIAEVSQNGISMTSQNTFNEAFWTEGFTVDGAGWGHGKQSLVWGYPIDGTMAALNMLTSLKGTAWEKKLTKENTDALLNFFRGSNWYYYKGYNLPCLDRYSMRYNVDSRSIHYLGMLKTILKDWKDSFTAEEQKELEQLHKESAGNNIKMINYPNSGYNGTRSFFNNDDLIKKNERYHILVNMASARCDGLESAGFADKYNFFTADGMTIFQKKGNEYNKIFGSWDVTAAPGVTAREGMDKLTPVTNWRGYCSKYNFAGSASNGDENAVAGFIFEKMNGSDKDDVNDKDTNVGENPTLYGVKAYKSYFMLGDYFVALGAGITNLNPKMDGSIRTTIDQTAKENEVTIIENGVSRPAVTGVQSFMVNEKPIWVSQKGKFAYTILPEFTRNASFVCESKKTNWVKMNQTNEKVQNLPGKADILRLWVDHGQKVTNGTYGYVVYAGDGIPSQKLPFNVLRNDTLIQAVKLADNKLLEAVFYKGNTQLNETGISLIASAPCIVLIEDKGNEYVISVTDPEMNAVLKQISLNFNGKDIVVSMPQGQYCGKPATIRIKK